MALWNIGNRPAGTVPDGKGGYVSANSAITDLDAAPAIIVNPDKNGVTSSVNKAASPASATAATSKSSDPYGGQPIQISTGNSASTVSNDSIAGILGSGLNGLFDLIQENTDKNNAWSAAQAGRQMDFQERMNQIAQEFNAGEAAKNRNWQEYLSNTAHQREVADLKAAGLNPIISASGGNGASVGSGATASISSPTGAKGDTDTSANTALVSLYGALINAQTQMYNANLAAKTNLAMADKQVEASMYGAQLAANANMYGSQMAYNASVYGSDNSLKNNREQREWNTTHPQTVAGAVTGAPNIISSVNDSISAWKRKNFGDEIPAVALWNKFKSKVSGK